MFDRLLTAVVLMLAGAASAGANVPGMADPTRPLRPAAAAKAPAAEPRRESNRLTLESVLVGEDRRVAVINGRRMTEGEERGGVKVHRIDSDSVVVSVDGAAPITLSISNSRMHKELR